MESALGCISRRAYAVKELAGKLKEKGYPGKEIAEVIDRMEEAGYLNDLEFAQNRIRWNLNRWGKKRIEQDLCNRGVSKHTVEDAFFTYQERERIEAYDWQEKAANALLKRFGEWQEQEASEGFTEEYKKQQKEKNRRLRFLVSRGYSMSEALYALEKTKR
jgi:regulatory protein